LQVRPSCDRACEGRASTARTIAGFRPLYARRLLRSRALRSYLRLDEIAGTDGRPKPARRARRRLIRRNMRIRPIFVFLALVVPASAALAFFLEFNVNDAPIRSVRDPFPVFADVAV